MKHVRPAPFVGVLAAAALAAGCLTVPAQAADAADPTAISVAPEPTPTLALGVIVKTVRGTSDAVLERAVSKSAASVDADAGAPEALTSSIDVVDFERPVEAAEASRVAAELSRRPDVDWAVPNRLNRTQARPPVTPNDPYFSRQLHLWDSRYSSPAGGYSVKAPSLWRATQGAPSTVVAVLDTGIRPDHPDLRNQQVPGYDMVGPLVDEAGQPYPGVPENYMENDRDAGRDADPSDPGDWIPAGDDICYEEPTTELTPSSWHGTHVAGIVAAQGNDRTGVIGVAPRVKVQPVRVLGRCGGSDADILAGIVWASGGQVDGVPANATPAKVANLSLGAFYETPEEAQQVCPAYDQVIDDAAKRGMTTVIAAGNESGPVANSAPATCASGAIVVGATSEYGYRAFYSNNGPRVDVMAPGGDFVVGDHGIWSTVNLGEAGPGRNGYAGDDWMGTSMSAPVVSAAVALLSGLGVPASGMRTAVRATAGSFAPVDPDLSDVVLTDRDGVDYPMGDLNCPDTPGSCGTGILDLSKVPAQFTKPVITGRPVPGQTVRVGIGSWVRTPTGVTATWLRDDRPVGTGWAYTVKPADLFGTLKVRFTQTTRGFGAITGRSWTVKVVRATTAVRMSGPTTVSRSGRLPVRVTVTVPGEASPRGTVRVFDGSRLVAKGTLTATSAGSVRVVLPRLKAGRHTLKAVYDGSASTEKRWSASRTIRVR